MMRGTTTLASTTCTATPSTITASTRSQSPVPTTNSAGSSVDTRVPKNGTTATRPVKMPKASQYGTPRTHSPSAVRMASTIIARSWPTTQARSVAPRSSRIRAATGRCFGETSARIPSRYRRGWRARDRAMTTTLDPSTNSLPPAVTYGRIDPRRKFVASSMSPATRPDWGLANSVLRSTGYSRAHAAITFWMLVSVCGSPEMSACVWSMTGGTRSAPIPTTAASVASTAAVVGIGALLVPPVIDQTQALISGLPQTLTNIQNVIAAWAREYPVLRNTELANPQSGLVAGLIDDATNFLRGSILPYVTAGGKLFIEGASVVVMALYLARQPRLYRDGILALVSPKHRPVAARILDDLGATLRAWVVGQLLAMIVLALLTALCL